MKEAIAKSDAVLVDGQVSRRRLLKFCGVMAATLALPTSYTTRIARAVAAAPRLPVVWLSFQECTGDTESFLRANDPTVVDLIFNRISLDFHEALMVASGHRADQQLADTIDRHSGQYICVVEGGIPTKDGGIHCIIGGRTALSIATETCLQARINIALGSCAWEGGIQAGGTQSDRLRRPRYRGVWRSQPDQHARLPRERGQPGGHDRSLPHVQQSAVSRRQAAAALRV